MTFAMIARSLMIASHLLSQSDKNANGTKICEIARYLCANYRTDVDKFRSYPSLPG